MRPRRPAQRAATTAGRPSRSPPRPFFDRGRLVECGLTLPLIRAKVKVLSQSREVAPLRRPDPPAMKRSHAHRGDYRPALQRCEYQLSELVARVLLSTPGGAASHFARQLVQGAERGSARVFGRERKPPHSGRPSSDGGEEGLVGGDEVGVCRERLLVDECLGLSDYSPVVAGDFGRELVDIILDLGFGKRALTMPYSSAVAASMTTDPRISSSARATDEGGKASDRAAAGDDSTTDLGLIDGRTFQTRESEIARQRELDPTPRLAPRIRAIETAGNRLKRVVRSSHGGSRLGPGSLGVSAAHQDGGSYRIVGSFCDCSSSCRASCVASRMTSAFACSAASAAVNVVVLWFCAPANRGARRHEPMQQLCVAFGSSRAHRDPAACG